MKLLSLEGHKKHICLIAGETSRHTLFVYIRYHKYKCFEIFFLHFQVFAFDHCFYSTDENSPKFSSEYPAFYLDWFTKIVLNGPRQGSLGL